MILGDNLYVIIDRESGKYLYIETIFEFHGTDERYVLTDNISLIYLNNNYCMNNIEKMKRHLKSASSYFNKDTFELIKVNAVLNFEEVRFNGN